MRRLPFVMLFVAVLANLTQAPAGAVVQNDPLIKLLAPPMTAVARLIVTERWDPRLDSLPCFSLNRGTQAQRVTIILYAKFASSR